MEINKASLENYLERVKKEMNVTLRTDSLTTVKDMGIGAILFCSNSGIISEQDQEKFARDIKTLYKDKWKELQKPIPSTK